MMVKDPSQPSRLPLKYCDQCPFFTDSVKTKAKANTEAISNSVAMDVEETQLELGFPCWIPVRRRFDPDSPFFASGNIERELLAKQVALDLTEDEKHYLRNFVDEDFRGVFCSIVGCDARLTSLEDFEDHYNARHTASCSVCSRVYPTSRLLSIHISEAHDSFFQAKVARGYEMYQCLVEGCSLKFKTYKSRHQHLVDKHKFPSSFEFFKKAHPSKKQRQKQQRKQSINKKADASSMEVENEAIDDLVSAVSKLSTSDSPSSISFGRRHTRGLTFVPRAVQRDKRPDST
ncbi:Zinc finger protein 511 [Morus notabilis]|uniref:Zinc finger protein 511 n=1 Tax=Morus notabilis TaxID=981085 RepID=W9SYV0_9ROSA|nr:zinc finger protein 511 [Morus notabilis]EXC33370.1 Zinc finger protein 511 [Morus notabilis]